MTRRQTPGVPQLLRVLNDRAALNLLFTNGPQTRAQLAQATSLSKVTASQMVERLESRGLIKAVGTRPGNRGPNAQVYAVVSTYAYVAGVNVGPHSVTVDIADLTGEVVGRVELETRDADDPVAVVHRAVTAASANAKIQLEDVDRVVLATPGIVNPDSNDIDFSWDLPAWHRGLHEALEKDLRRPVVIENDVNLAAVAEHRDGAARGVDDFVYVWFSRGLGVGVVLGGKLHRGARGGAGEIGYLAVPGGSLPEESVTRRAKGSFQKLVGGDAVQELGTEHGFTQDTPEAMVAAALSAGDAGEKFLDELADRMALGVAGVCSVLDPALVVLGGEVGYAGGAGLADRVGAAIQDIAPLSSQVVAGTVSSGPILRGALRVGLDAVREGLFSEE
ncbi:ROK family transcriptional regulator [Stackebrandtia nassauensis]|uniref:ROK family protein n=1 Tax=Stackebrandtia nassauensis (strain DSM 44728 / CIP 108903 / NRRL B-16338 / NBRC 102104 / LLR-40K-21) TaxID=446470 RepID=D3PZF4_STANL|nr:ROK family transcriptional regulator [Stackebrandtia nassauensis]ADD41628.1 ROK family protein [Stackebrandtia nassauensis DSM 44728]